MPTAPNFLARRALPLAEWAAENAYIPPGMHRLLAAGGLAVGLWGGRSFMDIVVARNHEDGSEMTRGATPQLFRPLHGIMAYNPYSDNASDRWKSVVDKFVPAITGGIMAYYGGKLYFHGKPPEIMNKSGQAFHQLSFTARDQFRKFVAGSEEGKMSTHIAEIVSSSHQGDAIRRGAAISYGGGATMGTDKAGALGILNHNLWAMGFADSAQIKPRFPEIPGISKAIRYVNTHWFGNPSTASVSSARAARAAVTWAQANLQTQAGHWSEWATPEMLRKWARDVLQNYKSVTEAEIQAVADRMGEVVERGYTFTHKKGKLSVEDQKTLAAKLGGKLGENGFLDGGIDTLIDQAGIDHARLDLGRNGLFSMIARSWGSAKPEQEVRSTLKKYFDAHREHFTNYTAYNDAAPTLTHAQKIGLWGSITGAVTATIGAGSVAAAHINKRAARVRDANGTEEIVTSSYDPPNARKNENIVHWFNGTPLNMMEWASRMVIVPPSMHRLMSAGYLSAALWGGMKLADVMTGRKLPLLRSGPAFNSELGREAVKGIFKPLRPLHGVLAYTPGSSLVKDRARMAFHYLLPVAFGAVGTYTGSALYFKDRATKLEDPKTLEDYTDKIALEQSKPFAGLTAITSIFNTGSGIHLIPFFNYSANLQSRYVLGGGLQVATPGLGKWWSGNAGLTPWGVKKTLGYVGDLLGQNPDQRPRELPSLVHSVLGKLYPTMPETELLLKKRDFLHALHEVRDSYFVDGVVPAAKQMDYRAHMKSLVTGDGFENLLLAAGFDPAQANLASNGVSGSIANFMGKSGTVHRLEEAYHQKYTERLVAERRDPRALLQKLADSSGDTRPSANDNHAAGNDTGTGIKSFADRLRDTEPSARRTKS